MVAAKGAAQRRRKTPAKAVTEPAERKRRPNRSQGRVKRFFDEEPGSKYSSQEGPLKRWASSKAAEKEEAKAIVANWALTHRPALGFKALSGEEYAEVMKYLLNLEIGTSTARKLFASKKSIVARNKQSWYRHRAEVWRRTAMGAPVREKRVPDYGVR